MQKDAILNNSMIVMLIRLKVFRKLYAPPDGFAFFLKELRGLIPEPDLSELEEKLKYLERNIYKSFPYTRYGSSRDAFCYRRVNTHLAAFKVDNCLWKVN